MDFWWFLERFLLLLKLSARGVYNKHTRCVFLVNHLQLIFCSPRCALCGIWPVATRSVNGPAPTYNATMGWKSLRECWGRKVTGPWSKPCWDWRRIWPWDIRIWRASGSWAWCTGWWSYCSRRIISSNRYGEILAQCVDLAIVFYIKEYKISFILRESLLKNLKIWWFRFA